MFGADKGTASRLDGRKLQRARLIGRPDAFVILEIHSTARKISAKRSLAGAVQSGGIQVEKVDTVGRAGGLAPRAGDQRQLTNSIGPDAEIVGGINADAGKVGTKRNLAGIV